MLRSLPNAPRAVVVFLLTCCVLLAAATGGVCRADQTASEEDDYKMMRVLVDTLDEIGRNYVKEVDRRELVEAAIRGMLSELDPYSNYISPDELSFFQQQVEQEFGGIGIQVQIDPKTGRLIVMTPLPGTPAYKAGVRAGDLIMEIEKDSTEGMTLTDAVKRLKGQPGEKVAIGVLHEGAKDIEQIEIIRDVIHVSTVLGDSYLPDGKWDFMLDKEQKIAYVRLTHFGRHSGEELREALGPLREQGMRALVLDLRFNPGGLLSQAVSIADLFIEEGTIVSTEGRNNPPQKWAAKKSGTLSGFPMAVLVNRFSASASEIVSACLQDHKRAVIIGERTWGKGSVQNIIELEGGHSALKLTTAGYLRPSGKNIHRFKGAKDDEEWGVMPDEGYAIRFSATEMREHLEYRRERDVLSSSGPPKSDYKDQQLEKALEYVRSQLGETQEQTTEKPAEEKKPAKTAKSDKASAPEKKADEGKKSNEKDKSKDKSKGKEEGKSPQQDSNEPDKESSLRFRRHGFPMSLMNLSA